jgi:hypothetical protein
MPKVVNPHYTDPVAQWAQDNAATFDTWLSEQDRGAVTFEDIKAAFPNATGPDGEALNDGLIHAAMTVLGYEVLDDD